jgi:hypothetical protein
MLQNTNLYHSLDNITKIRNLRGNVRAENSGGGLRLFIYDDNGNLDYNLSINGYNVSKVKDILLDMVESKFLKGDTLKELKSISRKSSETLGRLVDIIISLIIERTPIQDTFDEMVERWFENSYNDKCQLIKKSSDDLLDEMKKEYFIEIAWYYGVMWEGEKERLKKSILKKFDECRN